jgi:hypothetical protein
VAYAVDPTLSPGKQREVPAEGKPLAQLLTTRAASQLRRRRTTGTRWHSYR